MALLERTLAASVRAAAREFPAVVVTGPRQSGKTTLLQQIVGKRGSYVSLDVPDAREHAVRDPRGFLDALVEPVVLDEVQAAPELLAWVKQRIDQARSKKGRFFLSGSQNLLLSSHVTETLAGRAAILQLLPFARQELRGEARRPAFWERWEETPATPRRSTSTTTGARRRSRLAGDLWSQLLRGEFPELALDSKRDAARWYSSYLQTYLERDVRTLRQIGDLAQFQTFLRLLATRSGSLLDLTSLSRDLGVAVNTCKAWLSVLEASYQVLVVRPFHMNAGKRLVKSPKVYITDTGLLSHLVGLRSAEHAASGPMAGALYETAVACEIVKSFTHRGLLPRLSFWRTSDGHEVDFVIELERGIVALEAKSARTLRPDALKSLNVFRELHSEKLLGAGVVHPGAELEFLGEGVTSVPFASL